MAKTIHVSPVKTSEQMAAFIELPYQVYKDDPLWVPPLKLERKEHFSKKNPFFKHALWQFFLAYDENQKVIGRISAQIDQQEKDHQTVGHFGCLEATCKEAILPLLQAVEGWLKAEGIKKIVGPYSLSINDEVGLLINGQSTPPKILMNYAPAWYSTALEACNYQKEKDLFAYEVDPKKPFPKVITHVAKKTNQRADITQRPINLKKLEEELTLIMDIFNDAWQNNWGFTPMTHAEIKYMAKNIRPIIKPELARIIFVEGEPAAMIVTLPDANEIIQDLKGNLFPFGWLKLLWRLKTNKVTKARVLLMGVRQKYQSGRLGGALVTTLITESHRIANTYGYKNTELSWILEDNMPMRHILERVEAKHTKTYRIYSKEL